VQRKPGDAGCLAHATSTCAKERAAFAADESTLASALGASCGVVTLGDLRNVAGLGFAAEDASCVAEGGAAPATLADLAACVQRGHACRVDAMLAVEAPRASELLALVGASAPDELPCLPAGSDGTGAGIGDSGRAAALERCGKTLATASAKFARAKTKAVGKCLGALEGCLFTEGAAAPPCVDGARAACAKTIATLTRPGNGVEAKLVAAIAKRCGAASFADVLAPNGLGYAGLTATCAGLGTGPLDSAAALGACMARAHECRVEQLLEREDPRLRELIDLGGTPLP
jgi:hypothetical protein